MAIEKNAVERAIRPAWRARRAARRSSSSPGSKRLGLAQTRDVGVDRSAARRRPGVSGALGVSKLDLGLSRYSRRPPGAGTTPARALDMANIASQKKRILRSERERTENRLLTSTVKTHFRRLESAVESGDAERDRRRARDLVSKIDKAVQKGAMHRNTGARKKSKAAPHRPPPPPKLVRPRRARRPLAAARG